MPSLFDAKYDRGLIYLFKGEPGTRKSTAALSFGKANIGKHPNKMYWFSFDKKMEAMRLPAKKFGINLADIEYDDYDSHDKMIDKLKKFQTNCPFGHIVIDSLTSDGDSINRETIKYKVQARSQDSNAAGGKKVGNIYVPGMEEYNAEASAFVEQIALLQDIKQYHGINIILIGHVVGQRKADTNNSLTHHSRVIITGGDKISGKIASYMTEVYHFNIKPAMVADAEGNYMVFTTHTGNDYARTSLGLERTIVFDDKPLYTTFIEPAIKKLSTENK